jgi:murein DD-endopeptidase MepM/ murein hydrolase activator NlpD
MRRGVVALAILIVALLPASAAAQIGGGTAAPDSSGGTTYGAGPTGPGLVARSFRVTPGTIVPGRMLTVAWRIDGRVRAAQVRIDLLPSEGGSPAATLRLGHRATNRRIRVRWRPKLQPGTYTARLRATAVRSRRRARVSTSSAVRVNAPPPPPPAPVAAPSPAPGHSKGVFPVQGPYSFGGADARFGAVRTGHIHQGQDVIAAEGTPLVAPLAGTITWVAYQAAGAGYYVVLHGVDGRDYAFMHLQDGSTAVTKGATVVAGQRLGNVGATGDASGPHLHFEIWPDGWYAAGSHPIDPLPDLLTWARAE